MRKMDAESMRATDREESGERSLKAFDGGLHGKGSEDLLECAPHCSRDNLHTFETCPVFFDASALQ